MNFFELLQLGISVMTLGAFIFGIYIYFRNPDIKANDRLNLIEQGCKLKHQSIDNYISSIKENITIIKENHLTHIENDINKLNTQMTRVLTILEERDKK